MNPQFNYVKFLSAVGVFFLIIVAGSVLISYQCFPAYSHGPAPSVWCTVGLYSPAVAAVLSGAVIGWRSPVAFTLTALLVPIVGIGLLLLLGGWLLYWYGTDVWGALVPAALYCVLPAALTSLLVAVGSRERKAF